MKKLFSFLLCGAILVSFASCEDETRGGGGGGSSSSGGGTGNYEAVDLGLPSGTLWATFNVGATKPEDCGSYFAWGETKPKNDYSWSTYAYSGASDLLTKYCTNSYYGLDGFVDNKTILDPEDDAATANWGGDWRMPTLAEQDELVEECAWTWAIINGVNGWKVSSKAPGDTNYIFLPADGDGAHADGDYWSSEIKNSEPHRAFLLDIGMNDYRAYVFGGRCYGSSVRPVRAGRYNITLDVNDADMGYVSGAGSYTKWEEVIISATAKSGYQFVNWSDGKSDNPRKIIVTTDSIFTAIFEAAGALDLNGHSYVDLGLPSGTLWATCNVGATYPDEYGDYFAWGETSSKEDYNWDTTYKYYDGESLTKYCLYSGSGTVDNKTILDTEDDAASVHWGGDWRMPTLAEVEELLEKCTWTRTDNYNGIDISGFIVIGPSGKSIFLPSAGMREGSELSGTDWGGFYWSSSVDLDFQFNARYLNSHYLEINDNNRGTGMSIRPVCSPR